MGFVAFGVWHILSFVTYWVCHALGFVAYLVCDIVGFIADWVCCLLGFVAFWVCDIVGFVAYLVCPISGVCCVLNLWHCAVFLIILPQILRVVINIMEDKAIPFFDFQSFNKSNITQHGSE